MSDLPKEIARGWTTIAGVRLTMHVLDNGERLLEKEGCKELFRKLFDGELTDDEVAAFAKFSQGDFA